MNICIFGDSITYGACDYEKGGWVTRLSLYLYNNTDFDGEIYNLGVSGDNTEGVLERFEPEALFREVKNTIYAIGTNDTQYLITEKINRVPIEKFEENIREIISISKRHGWNIIFIGLIPVDESKTSPIPWDTNKIYNNSYIEMYNNKIKEICLREKVKFIDLFNDLIKEDYKQLLEDGLHPNTEGHQLITEKIIKNLEIKNSFRI